MRKKTMRETAKRYKALKTLAAKIDLPETSQQINKKQTALLNNQSFKINELRV